MHDELYELKEMLVDELKEYGKKGELSSGTLEVVDKLSHAAKNLCKIIEAYEEEEDGYSGRYSYEGGRGGNQGGGGRGGNQGGGNSNRNSYRNSYARGRGRNARRDSMGRYARNEGYSYDDGFDDLLGEMRELMDDLPEEKRRKAEKFISEMERM